MQWGRGVHPSIMQLGGVNMEGVNIEGVNMAVNMERGRICWSEYRGGLSCDEREHEWHEIEIYTENGYVRNHSNSETDVEACSFIQRTTRDIPVQ